MKLQDRNLNIRMRGKDVELLQQELRQLDFAIEDEAGYFGTSTRQVVKQFQEQQGLEMTGVVDEPTTTLINEAVQALEPEPGDDDVVSSFVVRGHVREADGSPFIGAIVRAFDKDLRHEELLGEEVTDESGHYEIVYTAAQFRRAEKKRADLIVRVFDHEDQELISSDILFNAQAEETVNLIIGGGEYRGPSEYEQLLAEITPVLENVPLTELSEEDISFLSSETGLVSQHIEFLTLASKRAQETDLPAEIFYGFARQDLPTSLSALFEQDHQVLRQALETALTENIIPQRLKSSLEEIIAQLQQLAIDQEVKGETSRGALVKTSPFLTDQQRKTFAGAYAQNEGSIEDFWDELGKLPEFSEEGSVEELQLTLQMGEFTQSHLPMVENLQERRQAGTLQSLRDLAKWDLDQWRVLIKIVGAPLDVPGKDENERVENYAEIMFETVENDYATAVVTNRLSLEEEVIPGADVLYQFLDQNPAFDLGTTDIDSYLGADADNELVTQLKSWQRVFRVSPSHGRYDVVKSLKTAELDSAQQIVSVGQSSFLEQYADKLGKQQAQIVWDNASQVNGLAMMLFTNLSAEFNKLEPKAVSQKPLSDLPDVFEGKPTLQELFGSLDFCDCEHCKSVYSAAAYFVNLMQFLKQATKKNGRSPLTVLLGRRPDLAEIELSCENTNIRMPYVDLVNEVLENAVVRFVLEYHVPNLEDLAANNAVQPYFNQLRRKFREAGQPISAGAKLTALEKRQRWVVTDADKSYVILKEENNQLYVYLLLNNQTRGKEEELSVQPEHINTSAYLKLAQAVQPWNLPFDLWWEEARIYMTHLGFERYAWMEKLPPVQAPVPHEVRIACDHLGLTSTEYELITGVVNLPEPELWGLKESIEVLRKPKRLLRQAGLYSKVPGENFKTLRQLVHAQFVDPNNDLAIRFDGDPCDLEKAILVYKGAGQANWTSIFNRMRRFLRLHRKLGWTVPDLDKAITACKPADLNATLIQRLSNLERQRTQLKLARLEMLSWWGNIDTAEDRSEEEEINKAPSLYEQVFLNKSVNNPVNALLELNESRNELKAAGQAQFTKISKIADAVAGALQIDVADLKRLLKGQDPKEAGLVENKLNLENLSALYRIVSFSKALKLKVGEFLAARAIIGIDPFADTLNAQQQVLQDRTANARKFIKQVSDIQASAFTISELDYLLRHHYDEATDFFVPTDAEIAGTLVEIHDGLAKIAAEAVVLPDPKGELTDKRLALLLEPQVVDQIIELLRWKSVTINLSQGVVLPTPLPEALKEKVDYDQTAGKLRVNGSLTQAEKTALLNLSQNNNYQTQINNLYDAPRTFLGQQKLKEKLNGFSWLVDVLKYALDQKSAQQERFGYVLEAVNEHLVRMLSENFVKDRLAGALSLDTDVTALMLEKLVKAQLDNTKLAFTDFLALTDPVLEEENLVNNMHARRGMVQAEKSGTHKLRVQPVGNTKLWVNEREITQNGNIDLEAGKFYALRLEYPAGQQATLFWQAPSQKEQPIPAARLIPAYAIASYRLLHKCALLLDKLNIRADELSYLAAHGNDFKQFDLNSYPLALSQDDSLYEQWQHLNTVFTFRDHYSQAKDRLIDVFAAAHQSIEAAKERLLALTDWNKLDFDVLAGQQVFGISSADLKSGDKFDKIHEAFVVLKRLGIAAEQLLDWAKTDLGATATSLQDQKFLNKDAAVQSVKQAVRAKYDYGQWLSIVKPLRDELRKKQRTALSSFLVHDLSLKNTNQLYDRYLIDVEMSSCMLTSRIVQAVGAVQLFVQRSLMGLEEPAVSLSPAVAKEWKWRKNYRVWEANRKVFLYPENWIEPELRDDKSPFLQDLENELLQNEVTNQTAEKAFLTYLEKLDEVARLEIVGMYEQKDEWYEWSERRTANSVLHVFGRTSTLPHVYYYRRWLDESYWTPWERVDLDIEGEHLIPVVWNRRLYLFWPIFTEKADEPASIKKNDTGMPPRRYLEIQLAWSEHQNGMWTAKRVHSEPLTFKFDPKRTMSEEKMEICFRALVDDNLSIRCCFIIWKIWTTKDSEISGRYGISGDFIFNDCHGVSKIEKKPKREYPPKLFYDERPRPRGTRTQYMMFIEDGKDDHLYLPGATPYALEKTPGTFRVIFPHQYDDLPHGPLFYQDESRAFFVRSAGGGVVAAGKPPGIEIDPTPSPWTGSYSKYAFSAFFHPYTCDFINNLNRYGVRGLLDPEPNTDAYSARRQLAHVPVEAPNQDWFYTEYSPHSLTIGRPYPRKDVEFCREGAYSHYNWEIFFHAPLLIADRLSQNQRFEEAIKWFHYIFDPTETADGDPPARFWKLRPFYEMYLEKNGVPKRIQQLMVLLSKGDEAMEKQVAEWKKNPFKPHTIARLRLPAYMKSVVMKYIDNLVAWGDQLFRQYTRESINEATQLYILAAEILGQRPERVPVRKHLNWSYSKLEKKGIDEFSNVLIKIENKLVASDLSSGSWVTSQEETPTLDTLFFCIPNNDKLVTYWDTVEDRLFKIRHCMTIEGEIRQLPLFQPPIDPGLLVRAAAAGIDIASVLSDLSAPLPHYRFQVMAQKASELCADVRSLGASLLSALEKKDAEELALLRSQHEVKLLKAVKEVKKQQIKDAEETLEGLNKASELVITRKDHYEDLIKNGLNENEQLHLDKLMSAHGKQVMSQMYDLAASIAHLFPTVTYTQSAIPEVSVAFGGPYIATAYQAYGKVMSILASVDSYEATKASIKGGHDRREEDWQFQVDLIEIEKEQIDKQIAAAEIREAISEKELKNHELQITNSQEIDTYMKNKFTNKQLYNWMVSQISSFYFQSYQLAYDLAKRAEKAFQHELAVSDTNFIQFGYWDSLKKGLLAGEKLHYDLKRMEVAYLEQNKREYELAKHVSLAMLDPVSLIMLKETGKCFVNIPEPVFDLDYPGHYMRRIKSVSLTIPCVTGPYTNVSCTLTLHKHTIRIKSDLSADSLRETFGAVQSIATSSAQNDSGIFELNFRDERYLPFEGAGAISHWYLELPTEFRQFDYSTISDIIFHISYTARDGGGTFKNAVNKDLEANLKMMELGDDRTGLMQVFSAKHEFPGEWHRFSQLMKEENEQGYKHKLELDFSKDRFPYQFRHETITVTNMTLFVKLKELSKGFDYDLKRTNINDITKKFEKCKTPNGEELEFLLCSKPIDKKNIKLTKKENWSFEVKEKDIPSSLQSEVKIDGVTHNRLNPDTVEDIFLVFQYYIEE